MDMDNSLFGEGQGRGGGGEWRGAEGAWEGK